GGQVSYIITVNGMEDTYIAIFDIWKPKKPITGRYIWLPIEFIDDKISISWKDRWKLSTFNK
ncbi:MAG: beta-glucanase, partial [Polaribacter sp.]